MRIFDKLMNSAFALKPGWSNQKRKWGSIMYSGVQLSQSSGLLIFITGSVLQYKLILEYQIASYYFS